MLKKFILFVSGICVVAISSSVFASSGKYYFSAHGGYSSLGKLTQKQTGNDSDGEEIVLSFTMDLKSSFNFGIAFGKYYSENIRAEIEINQIRSKTKDNFGYTVDLPDGRKSNGSDPKAQSVNITNIGVIGYYSIFANKRVTPYLGLGLGVGILSTEYEIDINTKVTKDSFARGKTSIQAILGCEYQINKKFSVIAEYRFFATGEVTFFSVTDSLKKLGFKDFEDSVISNSVNAGIKYTFA